MSRLRVNVVCYEDPDSWILGSLAKALCRELVVQGCDATLSRRVDTSADINHHIISDAFDGNPASIDSMMVTHVDTDVKVALLAKQLERTHMAVCMSRDTLEKLAALGLPREKLCFIHFPSPQAGLIAPRKVHVAVASRVYAQGVKREYMLAELAPYLPRNTFVFHIMGAGWEPVVAELERHGIEVRYYPQFDVTTYRSWWQGMDYNLYLGQDEGSTGLLDALSAGVPSIATPQGFHLDFGNVVDYPFQDQNQLRSAFEDIASKRTRLQRAVADLTWPIYAARYLALWRFLRRKHGAESAADDARVEGDTPVLEAIGVVDTAADSGPQARLVNPARLGRMPKESGPGGAVHRPRVLVLSRNPQETLRELSALIAAAPRGLRVFAGVLGELSELDTYRRSNLELRVADRAEQEEKALATTLFEFDAVCHWNDWDVALMAALARRTRPNYVARNRVMADLGGADTRSPLALRTLVNRGVKLLTTRHTTRQLGVLTRRAPLPSDQSLPAAAVYLDAAIVSAPAQVVAVGDKARRVELIEKCGTQDAQASRQFFDAVFDVLRTEVHAEPTAAALWATRAESVLVRARAMLRK